jgi:hypothetical protein
MTAAEGLVSADVQFENISHDTIVGPLKVRAIGLTSTAGGIPGIRNADNHQTGVGAIWDLAAVLPRSGLEPRQKTNQRRLEFTIRDLPLLPDTIRLRRWGALQLIQLDWRAYAKLRQ